MMADIADEHELDTGRRQEGIFFGAFIFAVKVTTGVGQFVAGWSLELIGFPLRADPGSVPPATVDALAIVYGPGLTIIAIVAIAIMAGYRIDRARHEAILAALVARREREAGAGQGPDADRAAAARGG
jgi:GPH family glycoside/pentoside/hexuronide:cation symporter